MTRSSTTDPLVGDVLGGRYEIVARLARGGMATVYRAQDRRLSRVVAVKVMHDNLGDDADFTTRFDREARAAARLSDPHVVGVFDRGEDRGRPYIVMEYVRGCTLRNLITREAPFDPARALSLIEPVAAALAAAHGSGLVHRDVKPENVLISGNGQIKVADFGLARAVSSQTVTAPRGLVIGTVSYMPPEVVTTGTADMRSDVYSTGIMLYEMLTGEKPHSGSSPIQVAYAHVNKSVPPPSQSLREHNHAPLPDYLDALVLACTRRDASMRPRDGRELLARVRRARSAVLAGVENDEAISAIMNPAAYRVGRTWRQPGTSASAPSSASASAPSTAGASATSTVSAPSSVHVHQPRAATVTAPAPAASPAVRAVGHGRAGTGPATRGAAPRAVSASPARMERRLGDPVRPSTNPWQPVGGQRRPTTPISPVDVRTVRPGRSTTRPGPRSQRTPRFPEFANDPVHRRRRSLVGVILVLLVATLIGLGSWWLTAGRYVSAPAVIGLTEPQALGAAQRAGVQISFAEQHSASVPSGIVLGADIAAGRRMARGAQLHAQLSTGPQTYPMPTVIGLSKESATRKIESAHLTLGSVDEQFDATHPAGIVTGASAAPGTQVAGSAAVDLTVSKGPAPVIVTDYTGKSADSATAELGAIGLDVVTTQQSSDSVPAHQVISQNPSSGQLPPGSSVTLVVSSGPQLVSVPDVRARTTADAQDILQKAGFTVQVVVVDPDAIIHLGRVQRTDPAQNSQAPKGSTISIYII